MNTARTIRIAIAAAVLVGSHLAKAAVLTWDNGSGDKLWTTALNWNPDGSPSGNDIVFATTGTAAAGVVTNDTDGSWTINSLNFLNTGSSGGAQTTRLAASQTLTISGTGAVFNVGPNGVGVSNASPTYVVFNGGGNLAITGGTAASITVATGTAGGQIINSLDMSALGSFAANVGSFTMATKDRNAAVVLLSASNSITATTLTVGNNATATSTNNNSYLGLGATNAINADTINVGLVRAGGTMAFQSSVTNGTITIRNAAGSGSANLVAGALNNSASITTSGILDFTSGTVDARLGSVTLGQGASGTGVGGGIGTLTLGPGTIIVSGTVNAGSAGSSSSAVSTAVGTVNLLANSGTFTATAMTLGRQTNATAAIGSGVVNQAGGLATIGTLTFANYTAAGTGLVSGTYNLSGGTLRAATIQAGANSATTGTSSRTFNWSGGTIQNFDAATNLTIAGSNSLTLLLAGTSTKTFSVDTGRTITVSAVLGSTGTAGFSKDGAGTLVLSATGGNWFSGTTTINAGVLNINSQWQLGGGNYQGLTFNGGTLQYASVLLNATTDPTTLGKPVTINAGGGSIDTNGNAISVANDFGNGGTGAFTKTGAGLLTLNGNATYTGATTVASGTLLVNGAMASSGVSVGLSAILGGTGTIANGVAVDGILSPGVGPGLLTVGSLTLNATGTTLLDVAAAGTRGVDYDAIDITTSSGLTYGGSLAIAFGGTALPDSTSLSLFGFTGTPSATLARLSSTGYYSGAWSSLGGGVWQLTSGPQTATFTESTGVLAVVPEPTVSLAVVASAAMGLMVFRRRRAGA